MCQTRSNEFGKAVNILKSNQNHVKSSKNLQMCSKTRSFRANTAWHFVQEYSRSSGLRSSGNSSLPLWSCSRRRRRLRHHEPVPRCVRADIVLFWVYFVIYKRFYAVLAVFDLFFQCSALFQTHWIDFLWFYTGLHTFQQILKGLRAICRTDANEWLECMTLYLVPFLLSAVQLRGHHDSLGSPKTHAVSELSRTDIVLFFIWFQGRNPGPMKTRRRRRELFSSEDKNFHITVY